MKTAATRTCLIGPQISKEQFIAEHLFFYLESGELSGYSGGKYYTLGAGEYGISRKNRLGRLAPSKVSNNTVEKIIFVLDEAFLKTFQAKQKITATKFKSEDSFLPIAPNELIPNFIVSLKPYFNEQGQIDNAFVDVKREELLLILLQLQPELSGVFFDYGIPGKINLEEFMNRNFTFNVSLERFAYLTGRSLSAFKRDFKQIFNDTPNHWLVQRRLKESYLLIDNMNKKPKDFFIDMGFEDLSHFSYAFKKLFGLTPTELTEQKKNTHYKQTSP